MNVVAIAALLFLVTASLAAAAQSVPANNVSELTLTAKSDHADPFNEVDVDVTFKRGIQRAHRLSTQLDGVGGGSKGAGRDRRSRGQ